MDHFMRKNQPNSKKKESTYLLMTSETGNPSEVQMWCYPNGLPFSITNTGNTTR